MVGECNVPAPNTDFVAVAAGDYHSLGLKADGSIAAWGWNDYGQCNVPAPNTDFVAVAAGYDHSLGIKSYPRPRGGLDIKPGSCPNPLNSNSHGVLPVAVVGSETFDVTAIDVYSVRLSRADGIGGAVAPNEGPPGPHSTFEDVATPFEGQPCDCHDATGDGILDLSLKFRTDELVEALELDDVLPGALVELVLSGALADGCEFIASDCVRIVPQGSSPAVLIVQSNAPGAWLDVTPLDDTLRGGGFAEFERTYASGSVITLTASPTHNGLAFAGWELDGAHVGEGFTLTITLPPDEATPEAVYVPVSRLPVPAPTPTPTPRPVPRPVIR